MRMAPGARPDGRRDRAHCRPPKERRQGTHAHQPEGTFSVLPLVPRTEHAHVQTVSGLGLVDRPVGELTLTVSARVLPSPSKTWIVFASKACGWLVAVTDFGVLSN